MDTQLLEETARSLVAAGKGLLEIDESDATCQMRFGAVGLTCTPETRREYRELLLTTPGVEGFVSGVALHDETLWQSASSGQVFRQHLAQLGILPGVRVDKGLVDLPGFPGEKISQGLDDLPERISAYAGAGVRFAKWRSVITIGDNVPTDECIGANTFVLARYARICQEAGVVPIVEPEVMVDGTHTAERCEQVMAHVFDILFQTMRAFRVHLPGTILKTSMVLPGKDSGAPINHDEASERTVRVFTEHVPADLAGIVFLSSGLTTNDTAADFDHIIDRLKVMNRTARMQTPGWGVTFSYSRALQDLVLKAWAENQDNHEGVQRRFLRQLQLLSDAVRGELDESQLQGDGSTPEDRESSANPSESQ